MVDGVEGSKMMADTDAKFNGIDVTRVIVLPASVVLKRPFMTPT
jgi:hypothetical protein